MHPWQRRRAAAHPPHSVGHRLPRAHPPPTAAPLTKWAAFAKSKGITKKKRDRHVWDEPSGSFKVRHGFGRARADAQPWAVPHRPGMGNADDGDEEPFAPRKAARRAAVAANTKAAAANERRAGRVTAATAAAAAAAGATPAASRKGKAPKRGKKGAASSAGPDALTALDVGTTVKTAVGKRGPTGAKGGRYVDKAALSATVAVSQRATASAGRFDKRVAGEKPLAPPRGKKRKFEPAVAGAAALRDERSRALGLADKVLAGY